MSKKTIVVACIPAFNEENTIAKVVMNTQKYVDKIVVCDDGSQDMTAEISERLGATVIREEHKGKGYAIKMAFRLAKRFDPDVVVALDADGQHNPEDIPDLIRPIIEDEVDMVVGSRYLQESRLEAPFYRGVGLRLINLLSGKSCSSIVGDTQCGFRAYSRKALETVLLCELDGYEMDIEQLALASKNGLRVAEVPVTVKYKGLRHTSKKNPVLHGSGVIRTALRLIVEKRPLRYLGVPGIIFVVFGIATGIYLLWHFNLTRYFSMPIALITLGALFIGMMLFITSIMLYAIAKAKKSSNF